MRSYIGCFVQTVRSRTVILKYFYIVSFRYHRILQLSVTTIKDSAQASIEYVSE